MPNVELHILQNFPPANLNRDDTGTPKDCEFGGVRRARISSQCIKRSIRTSPVFQSAMDHSIGIRSKRTGEHVAGTLHDAHGYSESEAIELAEAALGEFLSLSDETDGGFRKTKVLYYASTAELDDLADRLAATELDDAIDAAVETRQAVADVKADDTALKKDLKAAQKKQRSARKALKKGVKPIVKAFVKENVGWARTVDIALFGRMLAEEPTLNVDGACQVAHAISTNRVSMEFDFYSAVDDLNPSGETGAGMIGTTGYNSSCFYRYMLIDVDGLARNLSPEADPTETSWQRAADGVDAFVRAAVAAIPTGKQTSFAAQARPQFVLAVVRPNTSMPMSLVNAFEKPARPVGEQSLLQNSVTKLDDHWASLTSMYGTEGADVFLAMLDEAGTVDALESVRQPSVEDLVQGVTGALADGAGVSA